MSAPIHASRDARITESTYVFNQRRSNDFVHLHTHSEYSLLDGLGRVKKLVAEAKRLGQPALALTDHGTMHGAIEFFRACKYGDIKPIIGVEAYRRTGVAPWAGATRSRIGATIICCCWPRT